MKGLGEVPNMIDGLEYDAKIVNDWYVEMAKDVLKEKTRIGGTWVVAQAAPKRAMRDSIRKILGDQVIFVLLNLSEETNIKRIEKRHGGSDMDPQMKEMILGMLNKMLAAYEPSQADEENAFNIDIEHHMSKYDVAEEILSKVSKVL